MHLIHNPYLLAMKYMPTYQWLIFKEKGVYFDFSALVYLTKLSSRGSLVVELWTDNSLPSATVGSNLRQVWSSMIFNV